MTQTSEERTEAPDPPALEESDHWSHRPGLDGVRGLAVVAVVAYHLGYLHGGFLGVDVFLVLSGYLITGLALGEIGSKGTLSLRAFWGRRVRRLVPALLVVVTATVVAAVLVGWPRDRWHAMGWDGLATLTWWANWRQVQGPSYWDSGQNLFRHAWSLSIEEQFYVVWPLVLVACAAAARRWGRSLAAVVGGVAIAGALISATWQVVLAHRLSPADLSRVYLGTDARAVAPLLGYALACALAGDRSRFVAARAGRVLGAVGAVVLLWMMATVEVAAPSLYRHGLLILAALAAAAVVARAQAVETGDRSVLAWTTTHPVTRYLGLRSYAIYLWSWPIQVLASHQWPDLPKAVLAAGTVVSSLLLAEASYRWVETPIRRRTGWARSARVRRPVWTAAIVGSAGVLITALVLAVPPPAYQRVDAAATAHAALQPIDPLTTVTAAPGQPPLLKVMLTGDSVAWTAGYYAPRGRKLPSGIGVIDTRAVLGCGLLTAEKWGFPQPGSPNTFASTSNPECAHQPAAEAYGLTFHPDVVALFPGAWEWSRVQAPDGQVIAARSPAMGRILTRRLLRRITQAHDAGARFAMVAFSCPGPEASAERRDPTFIRWINALMRHAAATAEDRGMRAEVIEPTDEVCVGGDPAATPTPAKDAAMGHEVHITSASGGAWLWNTWVGPALVAGGR